MPLERASDAIKRLSNKTGTSKVVRDWRSLLPPGSRWFPGCKGNPACKTCEGTGYVRFDLPVGHADFGKIFLCDCAKDVPYKLSEMP